MKLRVIAYYIIGFLAVAVLFSIPYSQLVETDHKVSYASDPENRIEITYGGPKVTWVSVVCNITAEIHFMYPNGTWVGQHNVLLASIVSMRAAFNYNGEHSTTIIEIISEEPFVASITYTYLVPMEMSFFERILYSFGLKD